MKAIIETIAASIEENVDIDCEIIKHKPILADPKKPSLAIFWDDCTPDAREQRTTGYRWDLYEVLLEYAEPAKGQPATKLRRDEDQEQDLDDVAELLKRWADDNVTIPSVGVTRLDFVRLQPPSGLRRPLFSRGFRLTLNCQVTVVY